MADNKVIITCDSTQDLGAELIEKYGVKVHPLIVSMGEDVYADGEVTPDDLYNYFDTTGNLSKTAAPGPEATENFLKQFVDEGYTVIHFSISSQMSATYNVHRMAAEELGNIYVIDSANLSTGIGLQVIYAAELLKAGKTAEEVVEAVEEYKTKVDASFVVDTLEYLHKGGRCSAVAALGANLLKLKPCIEVKGGKMGVGKKYRGRYSDVLLSYVKERLADKDNIDGSRVFVTHSGCDRADIDRVVAAVKAEYPFKELYVTRAGCVISSHCGPNTLGVLFARKKPLE